MMKKIALIAAATAATLALAACGQSDDASADAMADTVEMPADDAMVGTPEPMPMETPDPIATETPEATDTTAAAADAAEAAVADVEAAAAAAEAAGE